MENTLICPQQVQSYGNSMCDDPYDPNRPLGLVCEDVTTIPLDVRGSMDGVTTQYPSLTEYESCRHLVTTSPQLWDPSSDKLPRRRSDAHVSMVYSGKQEEPKWRESEFDRLCSSICPVLSPKIFSRKLLLSHQFAAMDSKAQKSSHSPEKIARTFQIGIEVAKDTIQATTQYGACSAIHSITRRYRTDIVCGINAQRLPGRWYTDTFFSRFKSISGHACAQLFTNRK